MCLSVHPSMWLWYRYYIDQQILPHYLSIHPSVMWQWLQVWPNIFCFQAYSRLFSNSEVQYLFPYRLCPDLCESDRMYVYVCVWLLRLGRLLSPLWLLALEKAIQGHDGSHLERSTSKRPMSLPAATSQVIPHLSGTLAKTLPFLKACKLEQFWSQASRDDDKCLLS